MFKQAQHWQKQNVAQAMPANLQLYFGEAHDYLALHDSSCIMLCSHPRVAYFQMQFLWMKRFVFFMKISLEFVRKGPVDNKTVLV